MPNHTNWNLPNTSLMLCYLDSHFNDFPTVFYKLSTTDN